MSLEKIKRNLRYIQSARSERETYERMREILGELIPEAELEYKAGLVYEINRLKRERNALILGHNYMEPALYTTIPDHVGDSLALARLAAESTADIIVFCGVKFMAETAKILNPKRLVLLPSEKAGCSLAAGINAQDVRELKRRFPGVPVVTYINTYAEVKAETDICCTSANGEQIISSFDEQLVMFLPDEYLAGNVARETGRELIFPEEIKSLSDLRPGKKYLLGWHGKCEVHEQFTVEDIVNVRKQFPDVVIIAHPECSPEVVEAADYSGSTTGMIRYVQEIGARRYLLLTECSMGDNIAAANPDKEMLRLCSVRCPHMNEITLEDTLRALREDRFVIEVPEDIRQKALKAVNRMLEFKK